MKKEWWLFGALVILIIIMIIMNVPKQTNNPVTLGKDCGSRLTELENLMSSYNYCNVDSDCIQKDLGIMDFCGGHLLNKNVNLNEFNKKLNVYNEVKCSQPIDECMRGNWTLICKNKKCVFNETSNPNSGIVCNPNINNSQCPIGQKCWVHCNAAAHCATAEEIAKASACLPNA